MTWLQYIFRIRRKPLTSDEEKPFLDHLEDLRWMILKMMIALCVCMVAGFIFRVPLAELIQSPLTGANQEFADRLQALNPVDSISVTFKLAFYAGLVISFPLQLYYIAEFLLPGLTPRERAMLVPVLLLGTGLFILGVLFGYYIVLPMTLEFFEKDQSAFGWNTGWSVKDYYSFVTQFSIGFGLSFELPLVVMLLVKMGLIDFYMMRSTRSHAVVIMLTLAAIITPTTDPFTLLCMAVPLIILYEICIWISFFMTRRERAEAGFSGKK
jgi:sec-independent protein translocase protein TatC